MRRREFIRLFASTIIASPMPARAQNAPADGPQRGKVPLVGIFSPSIALSGWRESPPMKSFLAGLHDLGYEEGTNIAIEFRSAEGNWGRLPNIAAELVGLNVDVLIPNVCGAPLKAAMQATSTIPIVVGACNDDLVEAGIIRSLSHPGGNVTGLSKLTPELTAKRLELLKELLPNASRVAVLWDPGYSAFLSDWQELQARARALKVTLESVEVRNLADLDRAFAAIAREKTDAVITFSDTMTYNSPTRVADLATETRLPLISPFRELAEAGCLMSYGPNVPDMFRQAARYVDKILKGAKPADLPVEQPTKFELLINLKTAKALGVSVPQSILLRADEQID